MAKKKETKEEKLELKEYKIDYDMFSLEEIVKIVSFFELIKKVNNKRKYNKEEVINKYNEYRSILNNKALEKKYDKMLYDLDKISIYHTMKDIMENETR